MARGIFWLTVVLGVAVTVLAWFVLPDRVPLHFGGSGQVDRWGSRTEAVVTTGVVVVGIALLFWALTVWIPKAPASLLNIPAKDKEWWLATPERRRRLDRRLVEDLHVIGAATLLLVVVVELMTMAQAGADDPALGPWFWVALALYLVGVLGYTGYLVAVRYRAPRDGPDA